MEQLLGSSSPWIDAGVLLVIGVLIAAGVAALVLVIVRRAIDDRSSAGRVSGAVFWSLAAMALLLAIARLVEPGAVQAGLASAATRLFTALPDLLIAILVAALGWALAVVLRSVVPRMVDRFRPTATDLVAAVTYWTVLALTVLIVAEQLAIEVGLLVSILLIVLAGIVAAAALALGLGTRGLLAEVVAGRHVERIVGVGDVIEVDGLHGTVVARGHTSVRIAGEGGETEVPNSHLLGEAVHIISRARDLTIDHAASDTSSRPDTPSEPGPSAPGESAAPPPSGRSEPPAPPVSGRDDPTAATEDTERP